MFRLGVREGVGRAARQRPRGHAGGEGPLPESGVGGLSIEEGVQQDWFAVGCCGETSPARSPR